MALSMSVSAGAHNARHNTDLAYRANLRNVDADLSVGNISIRDVPIAEAYETVFGDYLSKIEKAYSDDSARVKSGNKGRVNVPKPCYEYVLQIGKALKALGLERLPDLQNLMMSELEKAAAAHGIERRLMDCDRKHLDVPEYQQAMRDYNELTDRIEQKRSRVAELDRDIEGKERTVARLDRSIETKTKRLASELDGRFY